MSIFKPPKQTQDPIPTPIVIDKITMSGSMPTVRISASGTYGPPVTLMEGDSLSLAAETRIHEARHEGHEEGWRKGYAKGYQDGIHSDKYKK